MNSEGEMTAEQLAREIIKGLAKQLAEREAAFDQGDAWEKLCCELRGKISSVLDGHIKTLEKLGASESREQRLREALQQAGPTIHILHPRHGITIEPMAECGYGICSTILEALNPSPAKEPHNVKGTI